MQVVAATLVHSLGVGQRGLKNDRRDARALSEAPCRIEPPSVHIPSAVSQEVKAICVSREALIKPSERPLHVVSAYDAAEATTIILTVYEPDRSQWDETFRRKR